MAGAGAANHAEFNLIPANLAAPVPDDVTDDEAAFGTLAAIALHGVRNLRPTLGEVVAVLGVGLVGQLAVQLLALSGIRVVAVDTNPGRLDLARRLGAEAVFNLADGGVVNSIQAFTNHRGADGILIAAATDSSDPLVTAAAIARDRARISLVGKTGTEFPFADFMKKELEIVVSRSYGPGRYDDDYEARGVKYPIGFVRWTETENLAECLRLMSPNRRQRLDATALITHRFDFSEAEAAYALIVDGAEPSLGVVLTYPIPAASPTPLPRPTRGAAHMSSDRCTIGVIGAGAFARAVLLPILSEAKDVVLKTVVTGRGASAIQVRDSLGFTAAATDPEEIFGDPAIDAVVIATPHHSHADLVVRGLEAGKHVFVEKPLALSRIEINRIVTARAAAQTFFSVGFNRRFAAMARLARKRLDERPGPRFLVLRINAGPLPRDGWMAAESEGGRVLGEVCHFIDLAQFLAGSAICSVHAGSARTGSAADDIAVTLGFADGGLATIAYTGLGDPAFPKEHIEAYAAGTVVRIEDFRRFTQIVDGRERGDRASKEQDKGHRAELRAFIDAVKSGGPAPVDEGELIASSVATLAILESLSSGLRIDL
jgi:predicted dehydrogenase